MIKQRSSNCLNARSRHGMLIIFLLLGIGCMGPREYKYDSVEALAARDMDHFSITVTEVRADCVEFRKGGYNDSSPSISQSEKFKIYKGDLIGSENLKIGDSVRFISDSAQTAWVCEPIK